jgi:hypothetical protein
MAAFRIAYGASQHGAVKSDRGFVTAKITFDGSLIFVCFWIKPKARRKNSFTDLSMLQTEEQYSSKSMGRRNKAA